MYRHGDVSFHPISVEEAKRLIESGEVKHEESKKKLTSFVVALGEVTGHKHVMTMERPETLSIETLVNGDMLFQLAAPAAMTHEEHSKILMEPGIYIRKIEREFDPFAQQARYSAD